MNTWRICEHCEHCVDDIGSGPQCDFDSPDLKSVTAEEACRYFSLNEDYVDELFEDNADLRAKLAAAEKERDEALSKLNDSGVEVFQLKPCPFCGQETAKIVRADKYNNCKKVICENCGASSGANSFSKEAAKSWNRREKE